MLSLAIHHNLWLTKEQRYAAHEGIELIVIGISVPVWVSDNRVTSEPAKEVFCRYYIKNPKYDVPIQIVKDGYEICLPCREVPLPEMSDEEWRHLNFHEPLKLDEHYQKTTRSVSSRNLLDLADGGSKCLMFREHNKAKRGDNFVNFIHFVNIADMEELTSTLI